MQVAIAHKVYNAPGSKEAISLGCICPVMDNCKGQGFPTEEGTAFWYTQGCPYHFPRTNVEEKECSLEEYCEKIYEKE